MPMNSARELFDHELEDIYCAEHERLDVLDVADMTAAGKTEHCDITAYGNLALMADRFGMDEAGDLLHENLEEEAAALEKLKALTDRYDFERIAA